MYDLKGRRIQLGLTLEEVGNYVGVGKSTVRKWENGDINNMGRGYIGRLAEILQISPLHIIKDDYTHEYIDILSLKVIRYLQTLILFTFFIPIIHISR